MLQSLMYVFVSVLYFQAYKVRCWWKFLRMERVRCIYIPAGWEPSSCCQRNWTAVNVLERVGEDVRVSSDRHNLTWIKISVAGVRDGDRTNRSLSGTSGSISTNTSRQPFSVLCLMSPKHLFYTSVATTVACFFDCTNMWSILINILRT